MSHSQIFDTDLAKRHPISILLVDDNAINLKVASRMLLRMGYEVDQATNGVEALEAQNRRKYDLIFMDIQMPEMDGVTATKHIIERYPELERPRIVAVTAHAMKGDRERYLDAGMDGYISKPVRVARLIEAIKETPCKHLVPVTVKAIESFEEAAQAEAPAQEIPIDFGMFAEMLGMDMEDAEEMLPELIELFVEDSVNQITMMDEAIKNQDYVQLKNAAHKMKGGAASVAAVPLSEVCDKLEKMGIKEDMGAAQVEFQQAESEFQRLKSWLENR
ncbi:MAG: response regulator [Anaerolineae bacterium]